MIRYVLNVGRILLRVSLGAACVTLGVALWPLESAGAGLYRAVTSRPIHADLCGALAGVGARLILYPRGGR